MVSLKGGYDRFSVFPMVAILTGQLIFETTKIPASERNRDLKETYTFETIILVRSW
jgi:hypothetical protein